MTFKDWNNYFDERVDHFDHINWTDEIELDGHEEALITSAIQQFQKGENSDGNHLMVLAQKLNNENYSAAMKGLIKEEQNHAAALGRFMNGEKIEHIQEHWLDRIFKRIIKTPNLQFTIMVLLAAEIVATVFYAALKKATYSKTLQSICDQILIDEEMHLKFQASGLKSFYKKQNRVQHFTFRNFYLAFMIVVALIAWLQYRKVFKAGGYSFWRTMYLLMHEFGKVNRMIIGRERIIPSPTKIKNYVS